MEFVIGTRGSRLALVQAEYVKNRLKDAYPGHTFSLKIIKTKGDLIQDRPLNQIGDKGLFVKEIEEQILRGEVHIGVHSMKDMPAVPAKGLVFTKCWKREDPRDVLILREKKNLAELPEGAVIGTGSMRRKLQLLRLRPDLKVVDIRGNVDTRLRKMEEQKMDGIVLAAAGLHRLGMEGVITRYLEDSEMIPAPAQGILALEIREDSSELREMMDALSDKMTERAASVERSFLKLIGGDCHVPIGALYSEGTDGLHQLCCVFGDEEGKRLARVCVRARDAKTLAGEAVNRIRKQLAGTVYLVGGGPGDPGLITVKGLELIRRADCIVYDRLSSPKLLGEAKCGCELIYVGKANHNHTMKQEEINQLLVDKALEHKVVVRLKGGDVYVFGRGGEEGIALRANGIPFEVVPGISSSIAGLSYAGIPITHRGAATGFHVVTAHNKRDELADIDFRAMASGRDTCVFLMGLSKLREIAEGLLTAGMPKDTEAAVISNATTNKQRTVTADLEHIVREAELAELKSPALIVVGKVVSLRDTLNFFEERPLFGKHYLVPKIGVRISELTRKLEEAGAAVDEIQVGEIVHLTQNITAEQMQEVDWLLLTSKNGVEAFFENLFRSGLDLRALGNIKVAAIGSQTAACLKQYGITADLVPPAFHSSAFKECLRNVVKTTDVIWYPKAANADSSMKQFFSEGENGSSFVELNVYENKQVEIMPLSTAGLKQYDGVFFTCASSAERLMKHIPEEVRDIWTECDGIYSIGPKSSEALIRCGIEKIREAETATYAGLIALAEHSVQGGK